MSYKRKNTPRTRERDVRQLARDNGKKTYTTLIPCKRGHTQRCSSTGLCIECRLHRAQKFDQTPYGIKQNMLKNIRERAIRKNIPFALDEHDIDIPKLCPILNIPLKRNTRRSSRDSSPTVDRIDPTKGYIKGNVQVISMKANRMKSNGTKQDIIALYEWAITNLL